MVKIDFSFTDTTDEETRMVKTFQDDVYIDQTPLEFMYEEFKLFLLACGFVEESVNRIQFMYSEED